MLFGAASVGSVKKFAEFDADRLLIWAPKFTLYHARANGLYFRYHTIWCWRLPTKVEGFNWDILQDNTECGNWWKFKCTKPLSLMIKLVSVASIGQTVLDPFMGSGTTGVACIQTGRSFIGCDTDANA